MTRPTDLLRALVTTLKGCEASSPTAFVETSLYYLLTDRSTKLPFIINKMKVVRYSDSHGHGRIRNACLVVGWHSAKCDHHRIVVITSSLYIYIYIYIYMINT